MKERPILFSGPMVRAILEGRKTQTRRIVKRTDSGRVKEVGSRRNWHLDDKKAILACPYGQPGDRLWVRESFTENGVMPLSDRPSGGFIYKADLNEKGVSKWAAQWKPSIHMPRVASRITLEITGIMVERLQNINRDGAVNEGVDWKKCPTFQRPVHELGTIRYPSLSATIDFVGGYKSLWESINGSGSWDVNPWVWVVEFKRVEQL